MAIKGLKEALAKKRAQQNPENQDSADADVKITTARPVHRSNKPQKRSAGRGR